MEQKETRKDNPNLEELLGLWKFGFTSGTRRKPGWVHLQHTGPGLRTIFQQVPLHATQLSESTVAGRRCRPEQSGCSSDTVSPKRDILFGAVLRYLHSTKSSWKIL